MVGACADILTCVDTELAYRADVFNGYGGDHHDDDHQVLKRDKELEEKKRSEVAEVATLVREAGEGLLANKWLVLHCNVFLKINSPNTRVLPAEVSFLSQLLHPISLPA